MPHTKFKNRGKKPSLVTTTHSPEGPPSPQAYKRQVLASQGTAEAAAELASRVLARRSLSFFTKKTHPSYDAGWVHLDICRRLERFAGQVRARQRPRLLLLVPPRHGKSELGSIRFPAWYLGHEPAHEIINVGYNLDLPMRFSKKVREIVRDPLYAQIFPETQLDPESTALEAWLTSMGGGYTAAGVGGGITGKGAHVLIVDDPIKNMEEADSPNIREILWDWFWSTAYTRLSPGGGVLLIQTWWNDDDLAGRLQALSKDNDKADQYEVVKYPALAEQYEYRDEETLEIQRLGKPLDPHPKGVTALRQPGEALHPARYDAEALKQMKESMQPRIWSALYQQNPVPAEGALFRQEYFRYESESPTSKGRNVITAWDFAIGQKQQNDWTVGATLIQDYSNLLHVVDIDRFRADSFTIVETMLNVYERYAAGCSSYLLGAEDGQIWQSIEPLLKRRMQERRCFPAYQVLKPMTDKLARARPLQGLMQQNKVLFPRTATWRTQTEIELLRFPAGQFADIVDALSWAVRLSLETSAPREHTPLHAMKSWKDKLNEFVSYPEQDHMAA